MLAPLHPIAAEASWGEDPPDYGFCCGYQEQREHRIPQLRERALELFFRPRHGGPTAHTPVNGRSAGCWLLTFTNASPDIGDGKDHGTLTPREPGMRS